MFECQDKNITRFAPSPTGKPHIGNMRTAFINSIYAQSTKSTMKLRIEDTDAERSRAEHVDDIINALKWFDIEYDSDIVLQSQRINRHRELAEELLKSGKAYKCYAASSSQENDDHSHHKSHQSNNYSSQSNGIDKSNTSYAVKMLIPKTGELELNDKIKGVVKQKNENLQDIVILRSDGTPTYMFAVVCDDHDMGVNLVIRGDDHLTNTFKQMHIYNAFGWSIPEFAHLPMLLAPNGSKLSKRNAVTDLQYYMDEGILPNAFKNYLLLLSWRNEKVQKKNNLEISEIFDMNMVKKFFNLEDVRSSPSKFDFTKLLNVNAMYIKNMSGDEAIEAVENFGNITIENKASILKIMSDLQKRAKTLKDLFIAIQPYTSRILDNQGNKDFLTIDEDLRSVVDSGKNLLQEYVNILDGINQWTAEKIQNETQLFVEKKEIKIVNIAQPVRICLTGFKVSPGIFEIMEMLGKDETIARINRMI